MCECECYHLSNQKLQAIFLNSLTRILIDGIQMILIKFKEEEPSHYFLKKENCQDNVIFC